MKKFFLTLCLTTATINAMEQRKDAYIKALNEINGQAATLAMQKNPTPQDLGNLIAQEEKINERYKDLRLDNHTLHSHDVSTASLAASIHDLKTSIGQYITMIQDKMDTYR